MLNFGGIKLKGASANPTTRQRRGEEKQRRRSLLPFPLHPPRFSPWAGFIYLDSNEEEEAEDAEDVSPKEEEKKKLFCGLPPWGLGLSAAT